jgi:hypothetical protein
MFPIVHSSGAAARQLAVAFGVAAAFGLAAVGAPAVLAVAVAIVVGALFLAALVGALTEPADRERARWLRGTTALVFVAHLLIGFVIVNSRTLVDTLGGDALTYHSGAAAIAAHWNGTVPVGHLAPPAGKEGFYYGLAALYWVVGPYAMAAVAVNAALAAGVVPVVHDTTRRLFGREAGRVAAIVYAVLPGFLVWTSQLLREAVVVFGLAVAANAAVRLSARTTVGACAALATSIAVLVTVRANVALVAAAGFIAGLALGRRHVLAGTVTGCAVAGFIAVVVLVGGIGARGYELTSSADLETVDLARRDLATSAGSGISPDTRVATPADAARFVPLGVIAFGFGPFPWTATNPRHAAGVVEALTLWLLLPSLVRGWVRAGATSGRRRLVLGVPALALTLALSLFIGNYGTVVRERLQVTVLLLPIVAFGWTLRPRAAVSMSPRRGVAQPPAVKEMSR